MHRLIAPSIRRYWLACLLAAAPLCAFQAQAPAEVYRPSIFPDRIIVNWTEDPATGFSVTWRTTTQVTAASAEIAEAEDGREFAGKARRLNAMTQLYQTDLGLAHGHSVTFINLKPSTDYLYRVGDGENWSAWSRIRTASRTAEPLTFIYLGDAQSGILPMWSRVIREAYAHAPQARFIVHAGDLINNALRDQEWGEWHQGAGWVNQMVPSVAVPGNHEYGRSAPEEERRLTPNWRAQFTMPANGVEGLEGTNYYIDIQGLRMIALNSYEKQQEQAAWLERVLSANPNQWTVATFHHPIYSTAQRRDNKALRELWQPIFDKYRVDLVLNGHDHVYGRTRPVTAADEASGKAGTVYVVSVSGIKFYELARKGVFDRVAEDTQLFQIIRIDGGRLSYECRTAGGQLYDAFELEKRRGRPNRFVNRVPRTPERLRPPKAVE
ncbi:MAG: fibronectin type III domain-containing protein [Bryobacteraceae bacterium]|nr:fibronectin type III domain-containing protein [Bryobacteraceae bacterium]